VQAAEEALNQMEEKAREAMALGHELSEARMAAAAAAEVTEVR
jgi:hypothetical protein